MLLSRLSFSCASVLAALFSIGASAQTTVVVNATASHAIPSTLYGLMFEDINHSGEGGLYGEMLQNRAFQKVTPNTAAALAGWSALNSASTIKVIADSPALSAALPNALSLTAASGATGEVGFANSGWWGIKVNNSWTYTASLYYRFPTTSSFTGPLTISLRSSSGAILASSSVNISGSKTTWTQVNATLKSTTNPSDVNNKFVVSVNAAAKNINFAFLSLFPPTWKGRSNGMRADIAETLWEMRPSFFRLPGGNNLEGGTIDTRWKWNATVGPLINRPGRVGDWGYINTDGLGLYEYLVWCEDMDMQAIMAVWAGYALGGQSVAEGSLGPYIQEAVNQINFVIGDASTNQYAAIRASMGHPEPFPLKYVELGNEDFFSSTYSYRWKDYMATLRSTFPNLVFIATTYTSSPVLNPTPQAYDVHVYNTPAWFAQNAFYYDNFQRNGMIYFEGEYAAISSNSSDVYGTPATGRFTYPEMQGSAGEAAFMTGLERNGDIVFAASYAPLLNHVQGTQWTPNLVSFDAGSVVPSTSYYVQQMFSLNKGDEYLPSTRPTAGGTLFWSVTRTTASQTIHIKVANTGSSSQQLTFQLPFSNVASSGTVQLLTGAKEASNTINAPNTVVPTSSKISTSSRFSWTAPGYSVAVLTVTAS